MRSVDAHLTGLSPCAVEWDSLLHELAIAESIVETVCARAAGRSVQQQGTLTPDLQEIKPQPGRDIISAIDLPTQLVAEEGLAGKRGAVVAIDPTSGDVVALASTPGFDPNPFTRGLTRAEYAALRDNIDVPLLNRALRGQYPSGSTIKPLRTPPAPPRRPR